MMLDYEVLSEEESEDSLHSNKTELAVPSAAALRNIRFVQRKRYAHSTSFDLPIYETPKEITATSDWFRQLVLTNRIKVPAKPILLIVAGLPGCDKSKPLVKMLKQAVAVNESEEATKGVSMQLHSLGAHHGITYYEFAAIKTPLTGPEQPMYSETSKQTFPLFAMEYALKCVARDDISIVSKYDTSSLKKEIFQDVELNDHFIRLFKCLDANHQTSSHLDSIEIMNNIPSHLALINVWDIGINKAVFHFLPAFWGYLDRSFLWMFLSLDDDANRLYDLADIDEKACKDKNDKYQIMRYRIRLHYLLRFVMLATSKRDGSDCQNVCSVFAMSKQTTTDSITSLKIKVEDGIRNTASQMQAKALIGTNKMAVVEQGKTDVKFMKRQLDSTVNRTFDVSKTMPVSFIFLRSLFYELKKMYITKDDLRNKAAQLGMSAQDVNHFCQLFMSCGSFFDINQIDDTSPYIIMKPMRFMCELDKIFYPKLGTDSRVTDYGLVTEEAAKTMFGDGDYQFFMSVFVSVDLAIELPGNKIRLEGAPLSNETYYYMPDIRTLPPELSCTCKSPALHLRMALNFDSPLCHLQVLFAREIMSRNENCRLVLEHNTPVNITRFATELSDGVTNVKFDLRYLGDTVEFRVIDAIPVVDEGFCNGILESCNEMMKKDKWQMSRYSFSLLHSTDPKTHQHCDQVVSINQYSQDDDDSNISIWKRALKKVTVPEKKELKEELLEIVDICQIAEKFAKLSPENFNKVERKLQEDITEKQTHQDTEDPLTLICKDKNRDKYPLLLLIEWESKLKSVKEQASKKALAKLLKESTKEIKNGDDYDLLKTVATSLDPYVYN